MTKNLKKQAKNYEKFEGKKQQKITKNKKSDKNDEKLKKS